VAELPFDKVETPQSLPNISLREEARMLKLTVNGRTRTVDVEPEMPLLWVLRDHLDLPGTKYGCGISVCGACTVHLDGEPVRSCTLPVSAALGRKIVTIEGLSARGLHRIQQAWIEHEVPQCGYCATGMIMAAAGLLAKNPKPTDADIDATMTNLCRCGTYARVRKAIHALADAPVTPAARRS
jgi:isoquinoline 1-oxidoreductase alpha subunit